MDWSRHELRFAARQCFANLLLFLYGYIHPVDFWALGYPIKGCMRSSSLLACLKVVDFACMSLPAESCRDLHHVCACIGHMVAGAVVNGSCVAGTGDMRMSFQPEGSQTDKDVTPNALKGYGVLHKRP
mgnify:CR=1 FL=1